MEQAQILLYLDIREYRGTLLFSLNDGDNYLHCVWTVDTNQSAWTQSTLEDMREFARENIDENVGYTVSLLDAQYIAPTENINEIKNRYIQSVIEHIGKHAVQK